MKRTFFFCSRVFTLFFLSLIAFFVVRCKRDENLESAPPPLSPLNVNVDYAINIAKAFQNSPQNKSARAAVLSKDSLIVDTKET